MSGIVYQFSAAQKQDTEMMWLSTVALCSGLCSCRSAFSMFDIQQVLNSAIKGIFPSKYFIAAGAKRADNALFLFRHLNFSWPVNIRRKAWWQNVILSFSLKTHQEFIIAQINICNVFGSIVNTSGMCHWEHLYAHTSFCIKTAQTKTHKPPNLQKHFQSFF